MIYFVQAGARGPVKIGKTENLARRMATLASGHYETLAVLAVLDVRDGIERKLHGLLREHHVNREWFRWCPEVERVVDLAKTGKLPEFPVSPKTAKRKPYRKLDGSETPLGSLIKERGLTVTAAAVELGISRSVVHRIASGARPASKAAILRIVEWSGGSIGYDDLLAPAKRVSSDAA